MLEHNGRRGSKGVDISYSPPPLVPPALQLTSWQPWGLWLVMAYCLDPVNAWPPLCRQRTHVNKSNPVSGRVFYCGELASNMGRTAEGGLQWAAIGTCETAQHWDLKRVPQHVIWWHIQLKKPRRKLTKQRWNLGEYNRKWVLPFALIDDDSHTVDY